MATHPQVKEASVLNGPVTEALHLTRTELPVQKSFAQPTPGPSGPPPDDEYGSNDEDQWESESLYEDALDGTGDDNHESHRTQLRSVSITQHG